VILDSDVAILYEVEREINQAIKNNLNKFPSGYVIELSEENYNRLRSKKMILNKKERGKHVKYLPKVISVMLTL
jgi:hypothetical protein